MHDAGVTAPPRRSSTRVFPALAYLRRGLEKEPPSSSSRCLDQPTELLPAVLPIPSPSPQPIPLWVALRDQFALYELSAYEEETYRWCFQQIQAHFLHQHTWPRRLSLSPMRRFSGLLVEHWFTMQLPMLGITIEVVSDEEQADVCLTD